MKISRWIGLGLLFAVVSLVSVGQEPEAENPPAQAQDDDAEQPPAGEETRTLEEIFIPSEEIAADEEVTFPVDI